MPDHAEEDTGEHAEAPLQDLTETWPVSSSVDLFRDDWVMALRSDTLSRPGHRDDTFTRLVLEHPGAVIILAVDAQERALVLRQYRHPAGMRFLELPAGLCDVDGEDPLATARRELMEEGQVRAERWEHLLTSHASPGISAERIAIYLATGLSPADRGDFTPSHEEADMSHSWVPVDHLVAAVREGRATNASLQLGVMAYALRDED